MNEESPGVATPGLSFSRNALLLPLPAIGAALIFILPILLRFVPAELGMPLHPATAEHLSFIIVGALIIFFLIVEPHGLARLWQIAKQKLRVWPYPY